MVRKEATHNKSLPHETVGAGRAGDKEVLLAEKHRGYGRSYRLPFYLKENPAANGAFDLAQLLQSLRAVGGVDIQHHIADFLIGL